MIQCKKELFLVSPIISKIVDLFKVQISKKDLVVDIEIDSNLELKTDSRIFSQIIQNILNNAIKYTYHKGNIVIKAEIIHNEIYVSISDTGIGIPKDKIPTLFEIDSKFNRPGTDKELSTGMGLILIKEYSEILGARLSVDSIEERGSTFSIIFQS
jgi:signal transduction histidine kinase